MQLRLDAADRLVELVEERRGPVAAEDAARKVLRLESAVPVGLARSLLDEAVRADARLRWSGDLVVLAGAPGEGLALEAATFVVFDLETTGLRPGTARPCEFGAVRVHRLELTERFQTLAFAHVALGKNEEAMRDFENLLRIDGSFELAGVPAGAITGTISVTNPSGTGTSSASFSVRPS